MRPSRPGRQVYPANGGEMSNSAPTPFLSSLAHHAADPFRLLVESVADYAIYMVDPAGRIASWNPAAERIYGYRADEIIGRPFATVYPPEDVASGQADANFRRAVAEGHCEFEMLRLRKDGSRFWAVVSVSDLKDYFGKHAGLSVVTRDVTERKQAEDAIRRERDVSAAVLGSLPGIYYMYDEERRFLRWNHQFEVATGYSADEVRGLHPLDLFAGPDRDCVADRIEAVFRDGACEVEADLVSKDGSRTPYYFNGVRAEIDGRRCLLGMGLDITARRRAAEELRRTGDLLRAVADGASDAIFVKDRAGRYLLVNPASAGFVGRPAEDMLGKDATDLFSPADARIVMEHDRRVIESNRPDTAEEVLTAAGVTRTYLVTKTPYRDSGGNVIGVLGIARDISERKQAEEALRVRNNLYAMLSRTNRAVSRCTSAEDLFREVCAIAVETGRFQFAWVGMPADGVVRCIESAGTDNGYMRELVVTLDEADPRSHGPTGRAVATGQSFVVNDFTAAAMTAPWHENAKRAGFAASASFPLKERGRVVAVFTLYASTPGFFTDDLVATLGEITPSVSFALDGFVHARERKLAEEKLEQSRALLRVASRVGRMGAWSVELDGLRVIWSEELLTILELPPDHHPDFTYGIDIYLPEYRPTVRAVFESCVRDGTPFDLEVECRTATGRVLWVRIIGEPVRAAGGEIAGARGAFQDITDRKQAAETLLLRDRAIQAVSQGILITDPTQPDNPIIFAGDGFERMTGYAPAAVIGKNCRILQGKDTDPEAVAEVRAAVAAGRGSSVELLNYRADGTPFWNQLTISPVLGPGTRLTHFVGVLTDVTVRRRLEEQIRQAQKMDAVGQLAGGVAHDFNNLLTVINGYSDLLLGRLAPADPMRELLAEIHKAGERAGTLTRQLLAFSRQQVLAPKVLNLNEIVNDTEKMLRRLIGEDVLLVATLSPALGRVKADPGQVEQVLMNLAVNARDAMPRGGRLTVETQNVRLDETYCRPFGDVTPGDYVLLAVADTGTGMDPATRARIFEPFFTTKPHGKGTGLGLATVHGIVKQSRGHVAVYSEVGRGTTFKVYLPRVSAAPPASRPGLPPHSMPTGTETILLVEDEDAVRTLARHVLRRCGYAVLEAIDGREAVRVAAAEAGSIHLLVSDVVMPHLGGRELAERIAAARPGCRVLFLSGYTDDAVIRHGVLEADVAFLQKPFTPAALAQKVRDVLDAPAPA